jgi:hypothetical protein
MKVLKTPQSGTRGDVVAKRNRYGQYEARKPKPNARATFARKRARAILAMISRLWNQLTEAQREAWRRAASEVRSRPKLGQSGRLTGQAHFIKINTVLALCGRELLADPPPPAESQRNPVRELAVTNGPEGIALKLRVSEFPEQDIMVFASPPYSRGRVFCNTFAFIGLLPAPDEQWSEITRLYLKKYGVPGAGWRVFIRTWPQVNGWEGTTETRITWADVPPRERARRRQAGRRAGAKGG